MIVKLYGFKNEDPETTAAIPENIFLIDGYDFGDRLLEGIMFEIEFSANGKIVSVKTDPDAEAYLDDLNKKKWLKAAKVHAKSLIENGEEVVLSEEIKNKYNVDGGIIVNDLPQKKTPPYFVGESVSFKELSNHIRSKI